MNRQEASLYFRLSVVPYSPVPPNEAMQTDGRFATAADRQGVDTNVHCITGRFVSEGARRI